jgi:hypothetical protein
LDKCLIEKAPARLDRSKGYEDRVGKMVAWGFGILRRGETDPFHGSWKHPALKTRLDLPFRGGRVYVAGWPVDQNGNSGLELEVSDLADAGHLAYGIGGLK